MKKYLLYLAAGVVLGGLCSCEDQLDRYPKDRLSPENFFHNEDECQLYTNDFYTMFPDGSGIYGETADVIAKKTLTNEVLGNRTVPATASTWTWTKLRDINFFLEYASNCEDEDVRLEYEGVARFFRAYFYFEKVKYYGDVPWVDRPIDASDPLLFEKGRDSRKLVMEKIIEDLDFAILHLPAEKQIYRVTRWTALALKSRACLFEGTFRKYHDLGDYEECLQECVDASERFIRESSYTIYTGGTTPYLDLFSSLKAQNSEIILARAYNSAIGLKHDVNGYLTSVTMGQPGLLKNIVNMYLMKDGTPFTSQRGWEKMTFAEECRNRDGRFAQTLRTPGYKRIDDTAESAPNLAATMTGYQLVKYLQSAKYDAYNASMNDLPLFRTAEVYLNYAEAKAELGTLTQADIDLTIKPLRDRAGVANLSMEKANAQPDPYLASAETGYANVTGANQGVILEIRRERTVELLMENLRYWDIMRWKEGKRFEHPFTGVYFPRPGSYDLNEDGVDDVCIWSGTKPETSAATVYELGKDLFLTEGDHGNILIHTSYTRTWNEDRDYLYPIPTDDRVLTQGAITQNPGWNDGLNF
uniref:RagB/SusD family nutrient uptake outer membrane protein n=1 Tax=Alistipes megaguti TaxID=2364787 RepID=UPI000EFA544C|nr:RagB/SusD family nutrient uptake outer membrane protein [Alistipes megaguti]